MLRRASCALLLMHTLKIEMTAVAYRGTGPAMNDLLGGVFDTMCDQTTNTTNQIKSGKIKGYAATTAARLNVLPDLPTLAESGVTGADASTFTGILAPAKTPGDIVAKLSAALMKTLKSDAVRERFATLGADVWSSTPEQLGQFIKDDLAKWSKVVKTAGIKVE